MANDKSLCTVPTAREDMGVNKEKAKAHPQLSYDALLIHGLALVFVVGTLTVVGFMPGDVKGAAAVLGVGLAATLVLALWSLLLAVRAWRKEEPSRWPVVVMGLVILEAIWVIGFLIAHSDYTLREWARIILDFLPLFVPLFFVFFFASLIAADIALRRTRRAEKIEAARGGLKWTTHRRWKHRLAWYCPVVALLFAIVLPIPLFVFCARTCRTGLDGERAPSGPLWVLEHTPEAVGNAASWLLSYSEQPWAANSRAAVLYTGRVSSAKLVAELDSPNQYWAYNAMVGLQRCHNEEFLKVSRMVGQGSKAVRDSVLERYMGGAIFRLGGQRDTERYLDPRQHPWPPLAFLDGLCQGVFKQYFPNMTQYVQLGPPSDRHPGRIQYIRNLAQYCDSKAPDREAALIRLAHFAYFNDIEPLWGKYLADKDPERRKQAIASILFIQYSTASLRVFAAGLESNDETLRRDLARNIQDILIMGYERADPKVLARLVKALLPFLDGPDLNAIQDSAWVLSRLIKAPELEKRVRGMANWATAGAQGVRSPASLTPEARKLLEDLRAAARKWLGAE